MGPKFCAATFPPPSPPRGIPSEVSKAPRTGFEECVAHHPSQQWTIRGNGNLHEIREIVLNSNLKHLNPQRLVRLIKQCLSCKRRPVGPRKIVNGRISWPLVVVCGAWAKLCTKSLNSSIKQVSMSKQGYRTPLE